MHTGKGPACDTTQSLMEPSAQDYPCMDLTPCFNGWLDGSYNALRAVT